MQAPVRFCDLLDPQCFLQSAGRSSSRSSGQKSIEFGRIFPAELVQHNGVSDQDIMPNDLRCGVLAGSWEFGLPGNLNIVAELMATGFLTNLADLFG